MRSIDIVLGLVAVALVAISAFLALAETALVRMNLIKALTLQERGRRGGGTLARLMEHPERWLNPLLFLNLLCNLVTATLVGFVAEHVFGPWGVVVATVFEGIVIFVAAEAIPKTWAVQNAERSSLLAAPLISTLTTFPPVRLLGAALIALSNAILPGEGLRQGPFVSEAELLTMADVAVVDSVIEREERALIHSIIEFGDTVAREVRVPRPDMVAVDGKETVGDVLERAIAAGFSRIPVFDDGIDDIVGIVFAKDLMRAVRQQRTDEEVRALVREAHFVPETKRVAELMREMQGAKFHMAIVVDEFGGTAGLVTLEDLIEELVGEIVDEYDVEEPRIEWLPDGDSRVNARMAVDELNDLIHGRLPEADDWDSVGGLVLNVLGHIPSEGESIDVAGWRLTAERVQGRRIGRVRLTRLDTPHHDDDHDGEAAVEATLRRLTASRSGRSEIAGAGVAADGPPMPFRQVAEPGRSQPRPPRPTRQERQSGPSGTASNGDRRR